MSEHTPGPWRVATGPLHPHSAVYGKEDGTDQRICYMQDHYMRSGANARLIVVAPKLLEALKAMILDVTIPKSNDPWAINRRRAHRMAEAVIREVEHV